jgi:toxin ParE1/3/4
VRVELLREAQIEIRKAAFWYDEQRQGLGEEFVAAVNAALAKISDTPHSFLKWPGATRDVSPIRRLKIDRFPYAIAFEVHQAYVLVLAVPHSRQRPLYWLSRTNPA